MEAHNPAGHAVSGSLVLLSDQGRIANYLEAYAPAFELPVRTGVKVNRGIGLLFLDSLSSALVRGAGRDAKHIVDHIVSSRRELLILRSCNHASCPAAQFVAWLAKPHA